MPFTQAEGHGEQRTGDWGRDTETPLLYSKARKRGLRLLQVLQAELAGCPELRINRQLVLPIVSEVALGHRKPRREHSLQGVAKNRGGFLGQVSTSVSTAQFLRQYFSEIEVNGIILRTRQCSLFVLRIRDRAQRRG